MSAAVLDLPAQPSARAVGDTATQTACEQIIAQELNAQLDAAQMLDGSAVLTMSTVQLARNTARKQTMLKN